MHGQTFKIISKYFFFYIIWFSLIFTDYFNKYKNNNENNMKWQTHKQTANNGNGQQDTATK